MNDPILATQHAEQLQLPIGHLGPRRRRNSVISMAPAALRNWPGR
jgi:hypothetical protein